MNERKLRRCLFVGGIHGSGKSTLCSFSASRLGINHYTASELIRRFSSQDQGLYKEVLNVAKNQDVLISAISSFVDSGPFILDGHFVIRSKDSGISCIPYSTFEAINPQAIIVVVCNPNEAAERLTSRDGKTISSEMLGEMQELEIKQANSIAGQLGIECGVLRNPNEQAFLDELSRLRVQA